MFKYYLWGLTEKALSYTPGGKRFYYAVGARWNQNTKGRQGTFRSSLRIARKGQDLVPPGGSVVDVGTGWFHNVAFLLYLVGDYQIYLFDVKDKATLVYIKNYLTELLANVALLANELRVDHAQIREKLQPLLQMRSREEIYAACNFHPVITKETSTPFLPEGTIDFMVSNCVLNHIPPNILMPELIALRKMLKDSGRRSHLLGDDDHWSFHDCSANQFNYYRYPA